jgi:DNA polymerase elongation subunit (family B)
MSLAKALQRPRILTLDIETSPAIVQTFGLHNTNIGISQIVEPTRVLCFAAKWHGEDEVMFFSEHHHSRAVMVQAAWDLLNQCDALCTYNGPSFDVKYLQAEFLLAGMTPPRPFKNIDLLRVVRSQFKFNSAKLDWVAQQLGLGSKVSHEGFGLWTACLAGDPDAWERFKAYNIQDVVLTEQLLDRLGPWVKTHPHFGMFNGDDSCCFRCGGTDFESHGDNARTDLAVFELFKCVGCGAWSRGAKRVFGIKVRGQK